MDDETLKRIMARRALTSLLSKSEEYKTNLGGIFGSPGSLASSTPPASNTPTQYANPFARSITPQPSLAELVHGLPRTPAQSIWPDLPTATQPIKRKVFFSFHYKDIMRVNNVRLEGKIGNRPSTFYDWSLWERKKLEGPDALKRMIREGVQGASTVCVLIGTETYERPWVRYEIARAIIDGRGLVGVHINSLKHHQRRAPDFHGPNPFDYMGVYKDAFGRFFIYEKVARYHPLTGQREWYWHAYADWTSSVSLPKCLGEPNVGYVMPLSAGVIVHDYCHPDKDIASWIDNAAVRAGR